MFWTQFWLTNLHFAGELFVAITSLLVVYVLLGIWKARKEKKIALRALGFLLFVLFSVVHIASGSGDILQSFLEFSAFFLIAVSFFIDPIQLPPSPRLRGAGPPATPLVFVWGDLLKATLRFANLAVLAGIVWRTYLKCTKGLERELKNLFQGFTLLFISEAVLALTLFKESSYIIISSLTADFGPVWIIANALKFAGFVFIAIWAWGYLRFKLFSQVVGAFVAASLAIFVVITFVYTSLLVQTMQKNALENLKINLRTFGYSVERVEAQALATASALSSNTSLKQALSAKDATLLSTLAQDQVISSGVDFLAIVDKDGVVSARGEDPEAVGDSLAGNFVVSMALQEGEGTTNITTREWVNAPLVLIETAVPLDNLGAVYTGYILDNAFVDGVKEATGLDVTVFGGEIKSATTLVAPDGISRLVGVRQTSGTIKDKVLGKGELFLGLSTVFQKEFLSAYGPLKDKNGKVLGMLFVGYPSTLLFEAAQKSLNTTFLVSVILAILSFIPAYLLAKFIEEHQV